MTRRIVNLAGLVLLGAGCAASKPAPNPVANLQAVARELFLTDQAFAATSAERGSDAAYAEFTDAASIRIPSAGPVLQGGAEIARVMTPPPGMLLHWVPENAEVARSGELGWTYGTYEVLARQAGETMVVSTGRYLTVWRRAPDGRWKVAADIGNEAPVPGGPP